MIMPNDFAKIINLPSGEQVLFYVEPEGGEYWLHQIVNIEGMKVDMKLIFNTKTDDENEKSAYNAFLLVDEKHAKKVYDGIMQLVKGE